MSKQKQHPQSCVTCKFGDYLKTPTGRRKQGKPVWCTKLIPTRDELVELLRPHLPDAYLPTISTPTRVPMWMEDDNGETCSQWQSIEKAKDARNPT